MVLINYYSFQPEKVERPSRPTRKSRQSTKSESKSGPTQEAVISSTTSNHGDEEGSAAGPSQRRKRQRKPPVNKSEGADGTDNKGQLVAVHVSENDFGSLTTLFALYKTPVYMCSLFFFILFCSHQVF